MGRGDTGQIGSGITITSNSGLRRNIINPAPIVTMISPIAKSPYKDTTNFTTTRPTITWSISDAPLMTFKAYQVIIREFGGTASIDSGVIDINTQSTIQSWTVPIDLDNNKTYEVSVKSKNIYTWTEYSEGLGYMRISADQTAPSTPTNLKVDSKTDSTVGLSWSASTDNIGIKGYDVYQGTILIGSTNGETAFTVQNLNEASPYNFTVKARDTSDNLSLSSNLVNVITNDITPPTAPMNLITTSKTISSIALTWSSSTDNVGVTGYNIYDGLNLVGSTTIATSTIVIGLTKGTTYNLIIKAVDAAGNISSSSNSLNVTTATALTSVISMSGHHTVVLKSDGKIWSWGRNDNGQLGDGTVINRFNPVLIDGLTDVKAVIAGNNHTIALKNDGTVWAWGKNDFGQLGDGTTTSHTVPTQILNLNQITAISLGKNNAIALKNDGTVWAWGDNAKGQLGDGSTTIRLLPVQILDLSNVVSIDSGYYFSLALKNDGTIMAWGDNSLGQLGDGSTTNRTNPIVVSGMNNILEIAAGATHAAALTTEGTVWSWGHNVAGQLGDGSTTNQSLPVQVSNLSNVKSITAGYYDSLALKTNGTVWSWGYNAYGELGDGTTINRLTPVQVVGIDSIDYITSGDFQTAVIKSGGTYYIWGSNKYGQLGNGNNLNASIPLLVNGLNGN